VKRPIAAATALLALSLVASGTAVVAAPSDMIGRLLRMSLRPDPAA
jgi:hypothetical protein